MLYKLFNYCTILLIVFSILSCTQEVEVIDEISNNINIIAISEDLPSKLQLYNTKAENFIANSNLEKFNSTSSASISKILEDRNKIYLLQPDAKKITILNVRDFSILATVIFDSLPPTDITIPNAQTAYITHKGTSKLTVLDISNYKIAKVVEIIPGLDAIASNGNQVYVLSKVLNVVGIIGTQMDKLEQTISIGISPSLISFTNKNDFLVITEGKGKVLGAMTDKTEAQAIYINPTTREASTPINIGGSGISAIDEVPIQVVSTLRNHAFVTTQTALYRLDVSSKLAPRVIDKIAYSHMVYLAYYRRLFLLDNRTGSTKLVLADEVTGKEVTSYRLSKKLTQILPLN
jgi:hypothetical protein